ncbi:MAG TPA: NEW3 domain-containing protein [Pelobium sp.]
MLKTSLSSVFSRKTLALPILIFFCSAHLAFAQKNSAVVDNGSSFTAKLMNLEAARNETFRYSASLHNAKNKAVVYDFVAGFMPGWMVSYKVDGNQVTSLSVDAGATRDVAIEITAAMDASPKKYLIPIKAVSKTDTLVLNLEAVVKGAYALTFSSPSGKLNEEVSAGSTDKISLEATNTGTLPLESLNFTSQLPTGWECVFEPSTVQKLEPGKSVTITANLKVPDKTIAGDYAATFTANNSSANVSTAFRMQVKASLLSGWIGILVILLAIGIVYYLIKKYGRR